MSDGTDTISEMRRPTKPRAATSPANVPITVWLSRDSNGWWIAQARGAGHGALDQERSLTQIKDHMKNELVPLMLGAQKPIRRRIIWRRVPVTVWERDLADYVTRLSPSAIT